MLVVVLVQCWMRLRHSSWGFERDSLCGLEGASCKADATDALGSRPAPVFFGRGVGLGPSLSSELCALFVATTTSRTRQNALGAGAPPPISLALTTNSNLGKGAPNKATARSVPAFLNKLFS